MAEGYIGLSPSYGFFNKQNIAGTTATTYNLDYDVANANQLIVSLDGIIQEPGYAFSVGRSSAGVMQITFAEALTVTTAAGNTTLGSASLTNITTTNISVGQSISGAEIAPNTFVGVIATAGSSSNGTITLTESAIAVGTGVTFSFGSRIFIVYLGNVVQTASAANANTMPLVEMFDGGGTGFTLSRVPPNASSVAVFLDGVFQRGSGNAYSLTGAALTFTGTTTSGTNNIVVIHLATEDNRITNSVADGAVTNAKLNLDYAAPYRAPTIDNAFSATTKTINQVNATPTYYTVNDVLVFLNGICLIPTTDYTISTTTLTILNGAPPANSSLVIRYLPLTG